MAAFNLAKCSRGIPRIAKKLLRRVRDYAQVEHRVVITEDLITEALTFGDKS